MHDIGQQMFGGQGHKGGHHGHGGHHGQGGMSDQKAMREAMKLAQNKGIFDISIQIQNYLESSS